MPMFRVPIAKRDHLFLVLTLLLALVFCSPRGIVQAQTTFLVTSLADGAGVCPSAANCTLRTALNEANNTAGTDEILFTVAGTINVQSALPTLTDSGILIDGGGQITLDGSAASIPYGLRINSSNNTVLGLVITGFRGVAGGSHGVVINNGSGNTIGGGLFGQRNVINANSGHGILITGNSASGNSVLGNYIGIDISGSVRIANGLSGVALLNGASNNTVGGAGAGARNVISGNNQHGVLINNSTVNIVQGNLIGLNAVGNAALGNGTHGVLIASGSSGNRIGDGSRNFISGNNADGIAISGSNGNIVSGNSIGVAAPFSLPGGVGNARHGIFITQAAQNATLSGNIIADNNSRGIFVQGGTRIRSEGNNIFLNGDLGIDLAPAGVTANDTRDVDTGANGRQNFPVLTAAANTGAQTEVRGHFNSNPNSSFSIEFFANPAGECDPSGYGEGRLLTGVTINVTTDANGNAAVAANLPAYAVGTLITAVATNANGSSSEFSACRIVTAVEPPVAAFTATPSNGFAPLSVNFTNLSTGFIDTYIWDFGDGSPVSNAFSPNYVYTTPGTYTVTLTVIGPLGTDTATAQIVVNIQPSPTVPPAASPVVENTPEPVTPATAAPTLTPSQVPSVTQTAPPPTITLSPTALPSSTPQSTATLVPTLLPTATITSTVTPVIVPTLTLPPTSVVVPTFTLTPLPEIAVTKSVTGDGVEIVIDNDGGTARNVVMTENLRPGVQYISVRVGSPLCLESAGIVICELGVIPGGQAVAVGLQLAPNGIDPASGRTVITGDGIGNIVIDEPYIAKIGEPAVAGPGSTVTYTIRVINPTAQTAFNVRLQDTMPEAIEIVSAAATSGQISINGQDIVFAQNRLEPNARVTITLTTRVRDRETYAAIVNRACLTSTLNRAPSCAEMRFLNVSTLPNTGESPISRSVLIVAGLMSILAVFGFLIVRVRRVAG